MELEQALKVADQVAIQCRDPYKQTDAERAAITLAAEVRRLGGIVDDYGQQIRERRLQDEASAAAGMQPQAWMVECPPGGRHDYDVLLFGDSGEARSQADLFNDDLPEGETLYVAVPLFTRAAAEAARGQT